MRKPITINVLIEREGDWWVAHCLQINVGTQAKTLRELYSETLEMIASHFETCAELGVDPFRRKAEKEYWDKYASAALSASPVNPEHLLPERLGPPVADVERVETRIAA